MNPSTTNHHPPTPPARPQPGRSPTAQWLARLRATARALLVLQRTGWVMAWVIGILLVAGAADYILRMPTALRVVLWVIGLVALIGAFRALIWPALRFRPSLTEVALRVENSPAGRQAGLPGVLTSGLELGQHPDRFQLADPVIEEARRRLGGLRLTGVLAPTRTARSLIWMLAAVGALGVVAVMEPVLTSIGATRLLLPLADAQWPKRTGVVDVTGLKVHPLGSALALRAAVTRTGGDPGEARVAANYRTIVGSNAGPVRRVLLTSQDKYVRLDTPRTRSDGTLEDAGYLFERLLEPSGLGAEGAARRREEGGPRAPTEMTLEYWFETEDDRTDTTRVLLVEPPVVVGATAAVTPPAYAAGAAALPAARSGRIDLGPGADERAALPPVLAGSRITVEIELNKPVPNLDKAAGPADLAAWAEAALGPEAAALLRDHETTGAEFATEGDRWRLAWTIAGPLRLSVKPTDDHGITSVEEATYRFDALRDNPPTATVTQPTEDRSVLATAVVELAGEGRDDVGLAWVVMESQVARRPAGSEGAPAEPAGERAEIARVDAATPTDQPRDLRRLTASRTLDLTEYNLSPGDEVWITAAAADAYELNGARHEVARSAVRKLRIMSREELVQQIWGELGAVRRTALRIDDDQKEIARASRRPGAEEARRAERAQSGITERLARQAEAISRLEDRVGENGLTDRGLQDMLEQARAALEQAGQRSVEAAEKLGEAARAEAQESPEPQAGAEQREQAAEAQEDVREELGRLIDMLDQGEDTYAAKRSLEQLLQQQRDLRERTRQAGARTTGKSAEQLSPQERQELQEIAQEQQSAAERLEEAIDKMLEREQKLRENDEAAAQQMAQAARRGQRERAAEKMQQAAQQVGQNQTNTAQQQQSQAIQSMEQMLQELDKTEQARDEVLRRYLASLIDSLRGLIQQQEARLAELQAAIPRADFTGLDAPMARLHQATLGVLDEAQGAPREAAAALEPLERAADAQAAAVVGLRDQPVNHDEVQAQEQLSLDKLNEALQAAQNLEEAAEDRQQARERAQLRARYQEALDKQISIRESAIGLVGAEPTRRNRATARALGQEQEQLRSQVEAIRAEVQELKSAATFDYAHTRIDDLMRAAAASLGEGQSTDEATRRQAGAARVLRSLVDALDNRQRDDKKFRERENASSGGGGGSQQQPLVPPAAELKLLRLMQQEAMELTREVDEAAARSPEHLAEVTRLQREVAEQAQGLLDRLTRESQGGGPAVEPAPVQPEEPEAEPFGGMNPASGREVRS